MKNWMNVRIQKPALDWINQLIHVNLTSAHIEYVDKKSLSVSERFFVAKLSPPPPGSHPKGVDKKRSIAEGIRARSSWAPSYSRSWWSVYAPSSSSLPFSVVPTMRQVRDNLIQAFIWKEMTHPRCSMSPWSPPGSLLPPSPHRHHHFITSLLSSFPVDFFILIALLMSSSLSDGHVEQLFLSSVCLYVLFCLSDLVLHLWISFALSLSLSIRPIILQHWSQTVFFSLFYGLHLCCPVFQVGRFCILSDEILNKWKQFPN